MILSLFLFYFSLFMKMAIIIKSDDLFTERLASPGIRQRLMACA